MILNPEQQKAVDHVNGPCLVTAVPGSGKTRVLTHRVISLLQKQVDPSNLLCLTFTNKAAQEMKGRIYEKTGEMAKKIWIGTFHSLCVAILRKFGDRVGLSSSFSIYDEKDQLDLIEKIARMNEFELDKYDSRFLAKIINDWREDMSGEKGLPYDVKENEILHDYLKTLDEFNAVDFSGLLYKTWLLLHGNKDILEKLSNRFQFISVDEAQDTNAIQYAIVKLIGSHSNIFMVGDFEQSIFSWRGAKPENMYQFKHDFPGVNVLTLPRNYRSKKKILDAAQNLIRNNNNTVVLKAERGDGGVVDVRAYHNPEFEAQQVVRIAKKLRSERSFKWSDFAILYRINSMSQPLEVALRNEHIPYQIVGGFSFFDRKEIKGAIAYLSLLANPNDTIAFSRAIQSPKRGIADVMIGKIEKICREKHISVFDAIKLNEVKTSAKQHDELHKFVAVFDKYNSKCDELNIQDLTAGILKDSGYYSYIEKVSQEDFDYQKRIDNVNELLVSVGDYLKERPNATLTDYLQNISLLATDNDNNSDDAVMLLTMHSAKGLEFPCVFIVGAEEGKIPHYRCTGEKEIEEERRLFYVAMTRAQLALHISYCVKRSFSHNKLNGKQCFPSQFINEIK